jgi:glycosyltransferase involved in cell wall biosynthesis
MRLPPTCVLVRDPRVPAGGFETWVETLATGLGERRVAVLVIVPGDAGPVRGRLGDAEIVEIESSFDDARQATAVLEVLEARAARGGQGVFFTMGYPYINQAGLNLRGSPWANVPVLHGRDPGAVEWFAAGPPARIVVPSPDHARDVRAALRPRLRWFRTMGRVVVIPHGVAIRPIDDKVSRPIATPLRVIAATRLDDDRKRPYDLLAIAQRALDRGLDIELTIAGSGPEEPRMRAAAPPNTRMLGAVPHERVDALLRAADILLSTSESEAFGLSIAEGLAAGCAVVAADTPGTVRELVNERTGCRVPVGDIDAFVTAIAGMVPRVREYGLAGYELVAQRYSRQRMLDAYAALIRSVARRTGADPAWRAPRPMLHSPAQLTLPSALERLRRTLRR